MKKTGRIVVVSGPSGVGKGSINSRLLTNEKLHLAYSVSMTTREKRNAEIDGINYFFVDHNQFRHAIKNSELIEYAEFIGNYYGTPRKAVEQQVKKGTNVLLEIEVEGATQVIQNEKNVLSVFLMPPSLAELQSRIQNRATEPHDVIKERLAKALVEIPLKRNYQYIVRNDTIENAIAKMTDIFIREGITDYLVTDSIYFTVEKYATEILTEKYPLFLEIIRDKGKQSKLRTKKANQKKVTDKLIGILANQVYQTVLENGDFYDLKNKKKVESIIENLMLDLDFLKK